MQGTTTAWIHHTHTLLASAWFVYCVSVQVFWWDTVYPQLCSEGKDDSKQGRAYDLLPSNEQAHLSIYWASILHQAVLSLCQNSAEAPCKYLSSVMVSCVNVFPQAVVNEDTSGNILQLQTEIKRLREALEKYRGIAYLIGSTLPWQYTHVHVCKFDINNGINNTMYQLVLRCSALKMTRSQTPVVVVDDRHSPLSPRSWPGLLPQCRGWGAPLTHGGVQRSRVRWRQDNQGAEGDANCLHGNQRQGRDWENGRLLVDGVISINLCIGNDVMSSCRCCLSGWRTLKSSVRRKRSSYRYIL